MIIKEYLHRYFHPLVLLPRCSRDVCNSIIGIGKKPINNNKSVTSIIGKKPINNNKSVTIDLSIIINQLQ